MACSFDYYRAGKVNGQGAILWTIRFFNSNGRYKTAKVVEQTAIKSEIATLAQQGWVSRGESFPVHRQWRSVA